MNTNGQEQQWHVPPSTFNPFGAPVPVNNGYPTFQQVAQQGIPSHQYIQQANVLVTAPVHATNVQQQQQQYFVPVQHQPQFVPTPLLNEQQLSNMSRQPFDNSKT